MTEVLSNSQLSISEPVASFARQSPLVLPGYGWEHYLSLEQLFQETRSRIRFLKNHIEIMAPISLEHESRKRGIGFLVEDWCVNKDIDLYPHGSATLKLEGEAGGEPDESYCIGDEKEIPDLVIEVALTSGGLSKREFYQRFCVPEVWIWREGKLELFVLDESGEYNPVSESSVLPGIDIQAIEECATIHPINQAVREFRKRCA